MHSGTLATGSSGSMQLIMLLNIPASFFSQLLPGTGGATVCDHYSTVSPGCLCSQLGVPVAWMLVSNGTKDIISFFLCWVRDRSPAISLAMIMTNRDLVQIGALKIVYPDSRIFLCKWHVLRAMQTHFNAFEFPELWTKVRALVNTLDKEKF